MESDEWVGLLAGIAIVLSILYIYRANLLAVILYFTAGLFVSFAMGAFILLIENYIGAFMSKKALMSMAVFLGYSFLRGLIGSPVRRDTSRSQELQPIDGEILPPLRERHVLRRIEQDIL